MITNISILYRISEIQGKAHYVGVENLENNARLVNKNPRFPMMTQSHPKRYTKGTRKIPATHRKVKLEST